MRKQVKRSKATYRTLFTSGVMLPRHWATLCLSIFIFMKNSHSSLWAVGGFREIMVIWNPVECLAYNYCFYWAQYVITVPKFIPQINTCSNRKICFSYRCHRWISLIWQSQCPNSLQVHQLFLETRAIFLFCITKVKPVTVAPGTELWSE